MWRVEPAEKKTAVFKVKMTYEYGSFVLFRDREGNL